MLEYRMIESARNQTNAPPTCFVSQSFFLSFQIKIDYYLIRMIKIYTRKKAKKEMVYLKYETQLRNAGME
ncbi:hypothetical protein BpHYR1_025736 [Brachionus plicatilis]|uniref:Uncharacterized protein n=1 Tax=Brachionus plicatilis TaxID=10195 RepID=A0A3M7RKS8_BRAPC|nr:hypothetical protein BpHYR1_025736 [Brachionus plicatilis]